MGFPLNRYDLFNKILNEENTSKINEVFSDVKLFALLIYDPILNIGIDNLIKYSFNNIDLKTGKNFLFFSLVSDFKLIDSKIKSRIEMFEKVGCEERNITPDEQRVDAFNLANLLNIDTEDFPVLLLSNNLKFTDYRIIKTDTDNILIHLEKIGNYCENTGSRNVSLKNEKFIRLISEFDKTSCLIRLRTKQTNVLEGFINLFLYKLAGYVEGSNEFPSSFNRNTFFEIYKQLKISCKANDHEELNKQVLMLITRVYGVLNHVNEGVKLSENSEYDSVTVFKSFERLMTLYKDEKGEYIKDIDYTPLVICLAKIIEIETNSSIVQWIREELRIEMPLYFKKYKPNVNSTQTSITPSRNITNYKNKPVNFNQQIDLKWIPPGSGLSNYVTRTLIEIEKYPSPIKRDYEKFVRNWKNIVDIRNPGAHYKVLTIDDFEETYKYFKELLNNDLFNDLHELRKRLKG